MARTKRKSYDINEDGDGNLTAMSFKKNIQNGNDPNFTYDNQAIELDEDGRMPVFENVQKESQQNNVEGKHTSEIQHPMGLMGRPKKKSTSSIEVEKTDDEKPKDNENLIIRGILSIRACISLIFKNHSEQLKWFFVVLFTVIYFIYFGFAVSQTWNVSDNYCHGSKFLFVMTAISVFGVLYFCVLKTFFGKSIAKNIMKPISNAASKQWENACIRWMLYIALVAAVVVFLVIDSANNRQRLVSAGGILILTLIGFLFSKYPGQIVWRQVIWGLALQFVFALLILRWNVGRHLFQCLGDKVSYFLNFSDQGSAFVFGYLVTGKLTDWNSSDNTTMNATLPFDGKLPLQNAIFAFKVLPVIFFFSSCISILYHYGIMQWIVTKLGWLLQVTVGTTAAESINAAANIFVGQTEAPLVIQPFLPVMTKSELHAVMTGGFATIAGGVLAAYINFGVSASHLLSASVMSAPAALGFSKLFYPEIEKSRTTANNIKMDRGTERNALEAAANGAANAIFLVANIAANLIAFIALISFINFTISWFGSLVGWEFLSFEWILSKVFIPLAYIMGVDWSECELVAKLIGLKTVVNEFVAYAELATMLKNKQLSPRAEAIATYALCGFSNLSSIGVQLGGLGAMAPHRRSDLAEIAVRALIAGSIACFLTACIAGTLIDGQ